MLSTWQLCRRCRVIAMRELLWVTCFVSGSTECSSLCAPKEVLISVTTKSKQEHRASRSDAFARRWRASESAAERSFSLNRLIRDGRYSLDHKNAENELIFASNAIEEADVPTERTLRYFNSINEVEHFPLPSVQSQPSKTQEDPQEIKRQGLSKYHEVIPARYGHSIIVLWYYTTQFWNPMLQMKIPTTESKRESKIDVMFFHLNS